MANNEVSTNEIMEFLQEHVATKEDLTDLELNVDKKMTKLKTDLLDAMDEKLSDLKGDLTILMRKEDRKVVSLIGLLKTKQVITNEEAQGLLGMEPFPQMS